MYFRQIAVATAIATAIFAMLAVAVATARVPTLDAGIHDRHMESNSAYSIDPDIIVLREEDIIP